MADDIPVDIGVTCLRFLSVLLLSEEILPSLRRINLLLIKLWSEVSSLLPPDTCLHFYRAYGSAFPLLVDFRRTSTLPTRALTLSANDFLCKKQC